MSDGLENRTFTAALPSVRILQSGGQSFYRLEIPMEMRTVLTPAGALTLAASPNGLAVKSPSPSYSLTAVINGRATNIKTVDAAAQPANTASVSFNDYTPATQGRMTRVDLSLKPLDTYADWAVVNFSNPADTKAAKSADPDGDGATNEQEFLAGTNPNSSTSVFSIVGTSIASNGAWNVSFQTVPGKTYQLMVLDNLTSFSPQGAAFTATASQTVRILGASSPRFVRIALVVP